MKICFLNRGRETMPGGDCIGLDATMAALGKRGIECVETGWDRDAMRAGGFDLAHVQHCNFSWSLGNYEAVRDVGLPYVLTPVYYPGPLLSGITKDNLIDIINGARMVLPFSNVEKEYMRLLPIRHPIKYRVIPNATDPIFHHSNDRPSPTCQSVLTVSARGNSDKNVPVVNKICERLGVHHFNASGIDHVPLATLYPHYKVFVNASGSERMSLTIGEALCAGCRVLATDQNWGNSHYPGLVTFDPTDEIHLEHLIKWALSSPEWDYRPNSAARCLTWAWVAEKLEGVYREVLSAH